MSVQQALPEEHPIIKAWKAYNRSDDYANSFKWAAEEQHRKGSMWAAFFAGYAAAENAANNIRTQHPTASERE